jgi:hypothetical protein
MTIPGIRAVVGATAAMAGLVAIAAVGSFASCSQAPPNLTTRTFQQPQRMSVVCLQVNDVNGNALPTLPVPFPEGQCAPVPPNGNGTTMPFHLYAVVTQTTPGALAVVDLTAGNVVDVDRTTPGVDFIAVGANPTDVAVSGDGTRTFVSSADPNKMAIYDIDNTRLLGNSTGPGQPLGLPDLKACALPQPPQALAVLPVSPTDAGSFSGSYVLVALLRASAVRDEDGGISPLPALVVTIDPTRLDQATPGSLSSCTDLKAVLGVTSLSNDLPAATDPPATWPDGVPYEASGPTPVPACPTLGADGAAGGGAVVDGAVMEGGAEDGGAEDGGAGDGSTEDGGVGVDAGASADDGGGEGGPVMADAGDSGASPPGLPPQLAHPTSMVLRNDLPLLYVADDAVPIIHVVDLHDPTTPVEVAPLLATSAINSTRPVTVGGIAISPTTHDYKTYLYAIDSRQGTLIVYDITDGTSHHTPLLRPHAELNPFAPPDRITFSAPVVNVAFVQHDWPLPGNVAPRTDPVHQYTGILCNPNPWAHPDAGAFLDLGAYYRVDQAPAIQSMYTQGGTVQAFPNRLRGVFGFATLSNGNVIVIDVDDLDAPCRRPDPMAVGPVTDLHGNPYDGGLTGVLDFPEPAGGPDDLNPYHAPLAYNDDKDGLTSNTAVTLEAFFPVSAPHRLRSSFLLRNDSVSGVHTPNLQGVAQLFNATGAPMATSGGGGTASPLLLPTPLSAGFIDPTYIPSQDAPNPNQRGVVSDLESASFPDGRIPSDLFPGGTGGNCSSDAGAGEAGARSVATTCSATSLPGVRLSFDDPTVHVDQDWTVTYEGALPTASAIAGNLDSTLPHKDAHAFDTLTLSAPGARFCERGIEDANIGQQRAAQVLAEIDAKGLPLPPAFPVNLPQGTAQPTLPQWTADYVEITDDLLVNTDPYWQETSDVNGCWDPPLDDPPMTTGPSPHAQDRYNACLQAFGPATDADKHLARDLPILHAFDDSLELGRFAWFTPDRSMNAVPEQTTNRVVVRSDPKNNPGFLRPVTCCFHHQATFKVRTGGEWVAVGSVVGLFHHVVKGTDAAGSCVLSCDTPQAALTNARAFDIPWTKPPCVRDPSKLPLAFDRNSPLAMRNPMFSFVMWSGCPSQPTAFGDHTLSTRDLSWRFTTRGSFSPLTVSLVSPSTGSAVSPQSMRFISSLGQLAIVDGESQGLVLIDLNLVAVTRSFF